MKKYLFMLAFLLTSVTLMAQNDKQTAKGNAADSLLNAISTTDSSHPVATFDASRLILSQTTEMVKKKNLNFLVIHRFGDFGGKNGGGKYYFGLDDVADVYIGFEYGLSNNLNIDIGRTTIGGLTDLELKYAILHQKSDGNSPIAITVMGEAGVRPYGFVTYPTFGDRVSYLAELMIARKFSDVFSLQVMPSFVSNNSSIPLVPGSEEQYVALSAAATIKVSKRFALVLDYAHPFSSYRSTANGFYDPLGFGIQVTTGGHVFTINITNARGVDEINYLNATQSNYSKGQFRIGFTISRMFDFNHKEVYK